jgi:hypothetical protein
MSDLHFTPRRNPVPPKKEPSKDRCRECREDFVPASPRHKYCSRCTEKARYIKANLDDKRRMDELGQDLQIRVIQIAGLVMFILFILASLL